MAFTIWYGYFIYPVIFGFEGKEAAEYSLKELDNVGTEEERLFLELLSEQSTTHQTDLGYKVIEQPYIEGRFHHIGFEVPEDKSSLCIRCHGNIPHDKSWEIRSFLNMHSFFLACETCHITSIDDHQDIAFRWYDKETSKIVSNPASLFEVSSQIESRKSISGFLNYGNYGAKITPVISQNDTFNRLYSDKQNSIVEKYLFEGSSLSPEKKTRFKTLLHKNIDKNPVKCEKCHQLQSPYIPFGNLGYPPSRVQELSHEELIEMIAKFKENYQQTEIQPGGIN